jgi:beta-glucanase (GH16 family)
MITKRSLFKAFAGSFLLSLIFSPAVSALPPGNWELVWSDEFYSSETPIAPDSSNWGYEIGYRRNKEEQYYTNSLQNAYCQNGYLNIEAHKHPPGTYPTGSEPGQDGSISSTSLRSMGKVSYKFGYFEIRARVDTQLGSWPAFWTLGNSGEWPDGGECDILEYYTGKFLFNVAWWKTGDPRWTARWDGEKVYLTSLPSGWLDDFHIWAMEWDTAEVKLYLDGALINTWDSSQDDNGGGDTSVEGFQQPHYMLINQAIGGTAGGDTSGMVFPTTYEVDWVRIWQLNSSTYCGDGTCSGPEDSCNCSDDCGPPPASESVCDDGLDDDCDGNTDCDDTDCNGDPACVPPSCGDSTCAPAEDQCNCPEDCGTPPATETTCNDGMDEDCDGDVDCDDSNCNNDPACLWTKVDDGHASISYSAGWGTYVGNPGYMGTEHYSWTTGAVATFSFTGTKARYYGFKRNDLGYADIYVDSVFQTSIDCYNSSGMYDVLLYETAELSHGPHTLAVEVSGTYNPASTVPSEPEINIDAFEYSQAHSTDLNLDGRVDNADVSELSQGWQTYYDIDSLINVAAHWLDGTTP